MAVLPALVCQAGIGQLRIVDETVGIGISLVENPGRRTPSAAQMLSMKARSAVIRIGPGQHDEQGVASTLP